MLPKDDSRSKSNLCGFVSDETPCRTATHGTMKKPGEPGFLQRRQLA